MAFETKSLSDLVRSSENALSVKFYGAVSVLRKTVLKVLAAVIGGALYMMELIAKRIWKDRFVSTCSDDCLDGFGTEYGLPHKSPLYARGSVLMSISGTESVNIPQGTAIVDESTGKEYEVSSAMDVSGSNVEVPVVALAYGAESDLDSGAELAFRDSTPSGISETVTVATSGISGGLSVEVEIDGESQVWGETADEYRARLLNRVQNPPAGGSKNDYWQWAMRFSFVTDCFVFANYPNTNSVSVSLANYNSSSISVSASNVSEAKTYITSDVRRPITADVRVFSVTPVAVAIVASVAPYTESVKSSVNEALKSYLRKIAPGDTVSIADMNVAVLANSTASTFLISSLQKSGSSVPSLELSLSVPSAPDSSTAPTAEVANLTLTLNNGES